MTSVLSTTEAWPEDQQTNKKHQPFLPVVSRIFDAAPWWQDAVICKALNRNYIFAELPKKFKNYIEITYP